jgi:hypothetical protein
MSPAFSKKTAKISQKPQKSRKSQNRLYKDRKTLIFKPSG